MKKRRKAELDEAKRVAERDRRRVKEERRLEAARELGLETEMTSYEPK